MQNREKNELKQVQAPLTSDHLEITVINDGWRFSSFFLSFSFRYICHSDETIKNYRKSKIENENSVFKMIWKCGEKKKTHDQLKLASEVWKINTMSAVFSSLNIIELPANYKQIRLESLIWLHVYLVFKIHY